MSRQDAVTSVCSDTTASVSHYCTTPGLQYVNSLMQLEPSFQKSMTFHPNHALHSEYPFTKLITINQSCIVIKQNTAHWNRFCMYEWYCCLVVFRNHFTYIEISHKHTYMLTPWQKIWQRRWKRKRRKWVSVQLIQSPLPADQALPS